MILFLLYFKKQPRSLKLPQSILPKGLTVIKTKHLKKLTI